LTASGPAEPQRHRVAKTAEEVNELVLINRFYGEIWNRGNYELVAEICDTNMTFRGSLGTVAQGQDKFVEYVRMVRGGLDQYNCEIRDAVVEHNRVFARMRFSGVHAGDFLGYPGTGKRVEWSGAALFTIDSDRVTDLWVLGDVYGLRQLLDRHQAEANSRAQS
jgi:predicted ester cyclase